MSEHCQPKKHYILRLLVSFDQFINVLLSPLLNLLLNPQHGQFGSEDETLSSVFAKNAPHCKYCFGMCRFLHVLDKDHCKKSIESDEHH